MNYTPLENFLLRIIHFTPQQLQLIGSKAVERTYLAGAYFSEAGRVAREIGFVVSLQSYQYQLPSTEYVQAVTEVQALVFSDRDW